MDKVLDIKKLERFGERAIQVIGEINGRNTTEQTLGGKVLTHQAGKELEIDP